LVTLDDVNFYVRGFDPTAIADVTLAGINIPVRIDGITILPGDVILGTATGIIVIPPHSAQEVVEEAKTFACAMNSAKCGLVKANTPAVKSTCPLRREDIEADYVDWKKANNK
jgi:regulator of RNase E activity RraA